MASASPSSMLFSPVQTRPEKISGRFLQALAASLAHHLDELLVDLVEHLLRMLPLRWILGHERVEEVLVLARGVRAPLDRRAFPSRR